MSKLIKANKLLKHKVFEPKLEISKEEIFISLLSEDFSKTKISNEIENYQKTLEEALKRGYEEGFKKGYEEGFALAKEQGYEDGLEEGRREAEKILERERALLNSKFEEEKRKALNKIEEFLKKVEEELKNLVLDLDEPILKLALDITQKMLLKELETDRELLKRIIREALNYIIEGYEIIIRVNPEEVEFLEGKLDLIPQNYKITLIPDMAISKGGLFIETKLGVIDATFERRWQKILNALNEVKGQSSE
ncbi:MAG: FliH/SctL family protein [Caldimicrobium sp.]|nr:FliH/SctL family protein [Caldimicrobium sp.]MCX7873744.1 FliH/SctL family protein [Caldimicrobium sp.]MDW8093668.1 FliH/SctL family protein [Caldimicrobium sp.]